MRHGTHQARQIGQHEAFNYWGRQVGNRVNSKIDRSHSEGAQIGTARQYPIEYSH